MIGCQGKTSNVQSQYILSTYLLFPLFLKKSSTSPSPTMYNLPSGKIKIALVALLAVVAVFAVLFLLRKETGPYHALPQQAAVVLEFNGLSKINLLKKSLHNPVWKAVLETTAFRHAWQDAATAEQLFGHDAALRDAFNRQKLLLALNLSRADSLHGLFILDADSDLNMRKLLESNPLTQKIFPSVFHGRTLYTVHLSKKEQLVVTAKGHLLLFSRFSYLVEDALTQLESSDTWWAGRKWLDEWGAGAPLRVFFRPAAMATQYENSMADGWERVPAVFSGNIEWLGLAWNGRELTAAAETDGFLRNIGWWGKAAQGNMYTILPDNAALLAKAYFDRPRLFFDQIKKTGNGDFDRFVMPWAGDEAAWVVTEPFSPGMRDDQFIVLAARDSALALENLRAYARQRGALRVEDYQTYEVFEFLSQSMLIPLLGESRNFRNPCCAMIGRYVVFANTRSSLELWIDKYIVSQTLSNDAGFLQLQQKNPESTAGAQVLFNAAYLPLLLKNLFDAGREQFSVSDVRTFSNTGLVSANLLPAGGNRVDIRVASQPLEGGTAEASILWKTPLVALAATQPFAIKNGGETAIVIQDARHELYRLNAGGTVVWRRQMAEPVLGAIQGIDFWGNGTLFFIFNTASRIWLLDDEGRDVQGFPLVLQSPATNGVIAVDFDKNLKYNYFIACSNGNLYGYDQFGRPLPGWNPQSGVGRVTHPVLHFQHGNKDYLAALNQSGKLFVYGRNGAERFPPVQFSGKDFGPPQADAVSKSPRITCANGAGTVFVCKLDGSTFSMQMGKGGGAPARLVFAPLSGDARYEYAVLKGKQLVAGGYEGAAIRTVFQTQFPASQDTLFAVGGHRVGVLNRSKRQIYMLNEKGPLPDFPLAGTTPFVVEDLFQKQGQVLVVGDGSSVYAYKIR